MADITTPAYSWTQGLAQLLGGGNNNQNNQTNQNQLVQALLAQQAQRGGGVLPSSTPAQSNTGTYEGNIPSAANPYNNGQYGMQPQSGTSSSAAAIPTNPFTQGAPAVPYLNGPFSNPPMDPTMAALFSQAPG
jgi:hypothetical protein